MELEKSASSRTRLSRVLRVLTFRFFVLVGIFAVGYSCQTLAREVWRLICSELPKWLLMSGF